MMKQFLAAIFITLVIAVCALVFIYIWAQPGLHG